MALINKRGDRQWRARVRRGGYPSQGRTFDTKYEAEVWARSIETEMDRGAFRDLRRAETTTAAQALERWAAEQLPHLSANTRHTETSRVWGLKARAISRLSLASVRAEDVTALINERKAEGRKADTIRLDLALLGRVFKLAATAWGLGQIPNPMVAAAESRPPVSSGRTRRVDPNEAAALVEAADELKPIIPFAIATALRRGEIATLSWQQVQLERGILTLHRRKNGESRTVPLFGTAIRILRSLSRGSAALSSACLQTGCRRGSWKPPGPELPGPPVPRSSA